MPQPPCCRASHRSPLSSFAEALMSGAEPIPEIRPAGLIGLRRRSGAGSSWRLVSIVALAGLAATFSASLAHAHTLTVPLADAYNTNPPILPQRALMRPT